jgi:hypothetical protein
MLVEKLENSQDILSRIGSVNLRSLEVYDEIKKASEFSGAFLFYPNMNLY